MAIENEKEELTFLCTECGEIYTEPVDITISTKRMNITAFNLDIFVDCEKCGSACIQVGDKIAKSLSMLFTKGYKVVRSDQGEYEEGLLYAPYIQLDYMGSLELPDGWRYAVGCDGTTPKKVIVPEGSFGAIEKKDIDTENMDQYQTICIFKTKEEFLIAQNNYIVSLEKWAKDLYKAETIRMTPDNDYAMMGNR